MAAGTVLLFILVLVALAVVAPFVVGYVSNGDKREQVREYKRQLAQASTREEIATKALRQIANGDATPVLTAGDALDSINRNYQKELNS